MNELKEETEIMGIWVRSQDRSKLVLCTQFYLSSHHSDATANSANRAYKDAMTQLSRDYNARHAEEEYKKVLNSANKVFSITVDNDIRLGTYDSEAEALQVLDDISQSITRNDHSVHELPL